MTDWYRMELLNRVLYDFDTFTVRDLRMWMLRKFDFQLNDWIGDTRGKDILITRAPYVRG